MDLATQSFEKLADFPWEATSARFDPGGFVVACCGSAIAVLSTHSGCLKADMHVGDGSRGDAIQFAGIVSMSQ